MPSNFYSADTTSVFFGLQRAEELRKEGNQPESDNEYQSAVQQTISVLGNQELEPGPREELTKLLHIYMQAQDSPSPSPSAQSQAIPSQPPLLGIPGANFQRPPQAAPSPPSRRSQVEHTRVWSPLLSLRGSGSRLSGLGLEQC
eukprot:3281290-Rhodomonas_salina.2